MSQSVKCFLIALVLVNSVLSIEIEKENLNSGGLNSVFLENFPIQNIDDHFSVKKDGNNADTGHHPELDETLIESEGSNSLDLEVEDLLKGPNEDLSLRYPRSENNTENPNETSQYNYQETSYLLTSDTALDTEPFCYVKKAKELEVEEDGSNNTHEAAISAKSLDKSVYVVPPLSVELSESTSLILNPNVRAEIYFEVTNNLDNASPVSFNIRDEMRILLEADKYSATLAPHQTITVRVSILPRVGMNTDRITFMANGLVQVRKEIVVDVDSNQLRSDDDYPDVDYTYTSDCTDVLLSKCQHGTWTIKILARDRDSGLMLLTSIPKGLYFPDGYVAGTKEEITGYYSDTCCNPDLQIIAVDRRNNRIVKQANAYKAPLSFWAITAIVIICFLILILIIVAVTVCVKRYRKNAEGSFELPSYRGDGAGPSTRY